MAIIEHKFSITIGDVGFSNQLTNKSILKFFEITASLHSDSVGYGLANIEETKLSWVLLNWKLKVLRRPKYADTVLIRTWSRDPQKIYSYRDFEMYDANNNLLAIASSKWALINLTKGLIKLDQELIAKYKSETKSVFNELEIPKLKEPDTFSTTCTFVVPRYVIDINKHMHNLCYLDVAYEALPFDIYEKSNFDNVEIMYKRSAKLGDVLKCFYFNTHNDHFITIKSYDEKNLHCIIKLS